MKFVPSLFLAALLGCVLWASSAAAQGERAPASEDDLVRARSMFNEGLEFVGKQDWASAAARFEAVLHIKRSSVVAYNLASAYVQLGRLAEAAELLRPIRHDPQATAEARRGAETLLNQIAHKTGSITVRATGSTDDVVLKIGKRELASGWFGRSVEVDPGRYEVEAVRRGEVLDTETVNVGGAYESSVEIVLELPSELMAASPAAAAATVELDDGSDDMQSEYRDDEGGGSVFGKWWFWTITAVVIAGGVTAGVLLSDPEETPADPIEGDIEGSPIRGMVLGSM